MLLTRKGVTFEDVSVSGDADRLEEMLRLSGTRSVPQIFINGHLVGGFDDLCTLDESGALDRLLGR
jgi:glutaredoxin 3